METSSAPGALPPAVPGVPAPIAIRGDAAGFSQRRISSSSPAGNVGFVAGVIARSGGRVFGCCARWRPRWRASWSRRGRFSARRVISARAVPSRWLMVTQLADEVPDLVLAVEPGPPVAYLELGEEPGDVGFDRRLPGRYQVGWGEGGVYVRGGCSGAGDSDERDRVGGDPVPVALECYEVVGVELACLQPLD